MTLKFNPDPETDAFNGGIVIPLFFIPNSYPEFYLHMTKPKLEAATSKRQFEDGSECIDDAQVLRDAFNVCNLSCIYSLKLRIFRIKLSTF